MKTTPLTVVFLFLFGSCSSQQGMTVNESTQNRAVQNAINDFLQSRKESGIDNVFFVYTRDINQDVIGVNIFGTKDKVVVITEDKISFSYRSLPTGYLERGNKFFYWHDSTKEVKVTDNLISVLKKYDLLDTMVVNITIPESTIDHDKIGTDYYFCKKNLHVFKKVRTRQAMGYYAPPKLNCDSKNR